MKFFEMHEDLYPDHSKVGPGTNFRSNVGILRSLSTIIIFILGICFGVFLLHIDFRGIKYSDGFLIVTGRNDAEQQPASNTGREPGSGTPGVSIITQESKAGAAVTPVTNQSTVIKQEQTDHKMQELTNLTAVLREELEVLKKERNEDRETIENLRKVNRLNRVELNMHKQQPPQLLAADSAAVAKTDPVAVISPLDAGLKAFTTGNYENALRLLSPLAAKGDSKAQYHVAMMYRNGLGILANNQTALKWMQKAAWQGNPDGQIELARFYANGINGVEDPFLAYTWYLVAEKNGVYKYIVERTGVESRLQPEMLAQAAALAGQLYTHQARASVKEATVLN